MGKQLAYVFCSDCNSGRYFRQIPLCPICSNDGKPRYDFRMNTDAGASAIWDRWKTSFVSAQDATKLLNTLGKLEISRSTWRKLAVELKNALDGAIGLIYSDGPFDKFQEAERLVSVAREMEKADA